jgi:hypothetical protein
VGGAPRSARRRNAAEHSGRLSAYQAVAARSCAATAFAGTRGQLVVSSTNEVLDAHPSLAAGRPEATSPYRYVGSRWPPGVEAQNPSHLLGRRESELPHPHHPPGAMSLSARVSLAASSNPVGPRVRRTQRFLRGERADPSFSTKANDLDLVTAVASEYLVHEPVIGHSPNGARGSSLRAGEEEP